MLTDEELSKVIGWMRDYPEGVHENAWGYGPMSYEHDDNPEEFDEPEEFSLHMQTEFG